MSIANRVAKNTLILYVKMGITMFISLYTTRLILGALGASDFGIFNIVGGAIAILGFFNAAMAGASQRFMSYYEGEGNTNMKKQIFNISIVLHFIIAITVGVMLLFAGYLFFRGILNIQIERVYAAMVVYGSLIISTVFMVMSTPYEAVLNAHENMLYFSIIGIFESVLKLIVALIIVRFIGDKLILFGILMACIPIISLIILRFYSHKKYTECIFAPIQYWDRTLFLKITSFAGWSFIMSSSSIISQYGLGIILNNFFGVILNAAQGIANQISGQLMVFSNTMLKAISPIIDKSEGSGNSKLMLYTSLIGSKYSFLLLAFFAVPFILETPFLLKIWLNKVPDWTILFSRLQLVRSLTEQLTILLGKSVAAKGDIKAFSIFTSILNITPIVLTYFLFSNGFPPYYMYIVWILAGGIGSGLVTLFFTKRKCGLKYNDFFRRILLPIFGVSTVMVMSGLIPLFLMQASFTRFLIVVLTTTISFILTIYYMFLSKEEKKYLADILSIVKKKVKYA